VAGQDFENLQENLVERAKELGIENRVSFRGEVSDEELLRLYSESEFFASASSYEGFGITAIEAMAAGLVPILNRIPTFERFAGEGRGIPTDFSDAKEGAKAMIAALEMPERKKDAMRKKNLDFCRAFSWEKKGKELRNVYSRILAGKREELRN